MKKNSVFMAMAAIFMMTLVLGCIITPAGISGPTKPILADETYDVIGPTEGRSMGAIIFGIPISLGGSKYAYERAKNKVGADALSEVTMDFTNLNLMFVQVMWTTCSGTGIRIHKK